jgi:hypothetical protein
MPTKKNEIKVLELPNGNIEYKWYDGTIVEMRDLTIADSAEIDQMRVQMGGNVSPITTSLKMLEIMCVRWGDQPKAPIEEIKKLKSSELGKIMQYIAIALDFFRVGDNPNDEGDDHLDIGDNDNP